MKLLNFLILTLGIILLFSCRRNVPPETSDIPQDTVKGNWKMEGWMGKWKFEPYFPYDTLFVGMNIIIDSVIPKIPLKISNGINEIIDTLHCDYHFCYMDTLLPTSFYRRNTLYSLEVKIDANKYLKGYFYTPNIDSMKIISPDSVPKNTSFTIRWQFFGVPSSYDSLYLGIGTFYTTCLEIFLPGNTTQYTTTLIDPCKNSDTILIGVGYIRKKIFVDTTKRFYVFIYRERPFKTY